MVGEREKVPLTWDDGDVVGQSASRRRAPFQWQGYGVVAGGPSSVVAGCGVCVSGLLMLG